jgi:hypothetical protein
MIKKKLKYFLWCLLAFSINTAAADKRMIEQLHKAIQDGQRDHVQELLNRIDFNEQELKEAYIQAIGIYGHQNTKINRISKNMLSIARTIVLPSFILRAYDIYKGFEHQFDLDYVLRAVKEAQIGLPAQLLSISPYFRQLTNEKDWKLFSSVKDKEEEAKFLSDLEKKLTIKMLLTRRDLKLGFIMALGMGALLWWLFSKKSCIENSLAIVALIEVKLQQKAVINAAS